MLISPAGVARSRDMSDIKSLWSVGGNRALWIWQGRDVLHWRGGNVYAPSERGPGVLVRLFGSVRIRLLVIALLPMLVLLPLLLGGTTLRWTGRIDDLLITKVNGDLTIADQYLKRLLENSGERLDAIANSVALRAAMEKQGYGWI